MAASNIDGKKVSDDIRTSLKETAAKITNPSPGLAILEVGSSHHRFVEMKQKACADAGIACFSVKLPKSASQEEVIERIEELNTKTNVHGIHLALPLPDTINEEEIRKSMDPDKDVDGMHPVNIAKLSQPAKHCGRHVKVNWQNLSSIPFPIPTTPLGCMELLDAYNVDCKNKNCVIVGRSSLVATPMARLFSHRGAKTVQIVHPKDTADPVSIVNEADILVAAVGKANSIKGSWIQRGCIILDVGINRVSNPKAKKGYVVAGDVNHAECRKVAFMMTPIGDVGQVTMTMLLRNTVNCCQRQQLKALHASF